MTNLSLRRPLGKAPRGRTLLAIIASLVILAVYGAIPAFAVHDIGVFQLDGNASTAINPAPTALEDWDLICKAHQPSSTPPGTCVFAPGYTVPSGTTVAKPSSFVVDPSTSATDDILKGGTKDDNDMNSWKWTSAKPSPPKNDLTDGYAAEYTCKGSQPNSVAGCTGTLNDQLLYFGADRFSNNGSANVAFWFFQKKVVQQANNANGTCTISSGCPFVDGSGNPAHHTVGNVSLGGSTPGDILIISAFGPKAQIFVFEWVGAGNATKNYLGTNSCFTAACSLQPLFIGSTTSDCPEVTNDNACALANDTSSASPWVLPQASGGNNQFSPTDLFEGGMNLTNLGLGGACFSSFLINSRASAAGDAELHDKILGQFARCAPTTTTQASTNGTVQPGTAVHDTATVTVTGATSPDDATGSIEFFLCGPNANSAPDCTTGGTDIGSGTLADTSNPANTHDGVSGANSPNVNTVAAPLDPGFYCFRAEAHLTNYDNPDAATNTTTECFRVAETSSTSTAQNWLPNDSATVTLGSGNPATVGSVTFTLYDDAACAGNVVHTFGPFNVDSNGQASTNNSTFAIATTPGETISWRVTYTSGDANIGNSTSHCETSTVTINDDIGS
jgi:hypothetical protein